MNLSGFMYVNICNLNFRSLTAFHSRHNAITDFYFTMAVAPILFFVSSALVLKGEHDTKCSLQLGQKTSRRCFSEVYNYN